ncbi:MAG: molybdenum cofactor guanylyltransferase [Bacteroidota bacterium]
MAGGEVIWGVVLAGGDSRRMGRDKALIPFKGIPMAAHIVATLAHAVGHVVVVTSPDRSYSFQGIDVIHDIFPGQGPLAGIHAAFETLRADSLFVLACDTPFVRVELIRHIIDQSRDASVTVAEMGGRVHPLCGLYRSPVLPAITRRLNEGKLKVKDLLEEVGAKRVLIGPDLSFYRENLLANVNTKNDFEI